MRRRGPYAKSAERRAAIVDAAFEVFAARGYRGGSLQEVADRVGMSQTSLFHYFPTKRDLLLAVLAKRDVAEARLPEPVDPARLEALGVRPDAAADDLAAGVVRRALANEGVPGLIELYTVLLGEAASEDHPAREYFATRYAGSRAGWADDLRALAAEGRLREGVDPDRAAASVVALWDGLQTEWLFDRDGVDVAACLRDYLDLIVLPPRG